MADRRVLSFIGFGLGAVTTAVALIAAVVIADAQRHVAEQAPATSAASTR
jgi:hypothetical protein